jgi:short-subunit dehydrogenase
MRPRNILITGASRGIGAAVAGAYAAPGVTLGLLGRNAAPLREVAERCRQAGAEVSEIVADLRERR